MQAPTGDDMDQLYTGGGSEPGEGKGKSVDEENAETMAKSAVVPMAVLQGSPDDKIKVGDERVVKVTALHGEDAEIVYSKTPPAEIPAGEDYSKDGADKELDELGKSY